MYLKTRMFWFNFRPASTIILVVLVAFSTYMAIYYDFELYAPMFAAIGFSIALLAVLAAGVLEGAVKRYDVGEVDGVPVRYLKGVSADLLTVAGVKRALPRRYWYRRDIVEANHRKRGRAEAFLGLAKFVVVLVLLVGIPYHLYEGIVVEGEVESIEFVIYGSRSIFGDEAHQWENAWDITFTDGREIRIRRGDIPAEEFGAVAIFGETPYDIGPGDHVEARLRWWKYAYEIEVVN